MKIKWSTINSFGQMRYSKTSYYVLVLVPILVKLTEQIKYPSQFLGLNIESTVQLPFSWYIFYLGAIFIAFGSLIYQLFCPPMIKKYKNYGAFVEAGESTDYLERTKGKYRLDILLGIDLFERPWTEEKIVLPPIEGLRHPKTLLPKEPEMITIGYNQNHKFYVQEKNAFNRLYNDVNKLSPNLILLAFLLYISGFVAIGYITLENILFVIKTL